MNSHYQKLWLLTLFGLASTCLVPNAQAQNLGPAPLPPITHASYQDEETAEEVAEEEEEDDLDFLDQDLDEIRNTQVASGAMSEEVTSASRTAQPIGRTASAIYVITNEMIKRSGARNLPEALRMAPGVSVARINSGAWAVSIRGFRGRFSDKLLVQIDGVAIYNPLNTGTFWDRFPVMMADIERIEIIRGPGGTVWGANAVNGVINVVTKAPKDAQGIYADVGGGSEHAQFSNVRVGGREGNLTYRVYGSYHNDNSGFVAAPNVARDYWRMGYGGFRTDWTPTCCDTITFQGDFANGNFGLGGFDTPGTSMTEQDVQRTMLLTRWTHEIDDDSDWALQMYYQDSYGSDAVIESFTTFDLDLTYHHRLGDHDVVAGFGYRSNREFFNVGMGFMASDNEEIPSYFVQDTITLLDDELFATFGIKLDHNSVTDFEYQPTAKLAWTPGDKTSIWGSISRAVRTPSLIDRMLAPLKSEDMLSYEIGLRRQSTEKFFWELTGFFNRYDNLTGTGGGGFWASNVTNGDTYGFEINGKYEVNPCWHLTGSYSFFIENLGYGAVYSPFLIPTGNTPRNMAFLHSSWDLGYNISLDTIFRYNDSLVMGIDNYFVGDIRLAWRPTCNLEFAVVGQDLYEGRHYEFPASGAANPTETEPGVYGMVSYEF